MTCLYIFRFCSIIFLAYFTCVCVHTCVTQFRTGWKQNNGDKVSFAGLHCIYFLHCIYVYLVCLQVHSYTCTTISVLHVIYIDYKLSVFSCLFSNWFLPEWFLCSKSIVNLPNSGTFFDEVTDCQVARVGVSVTWNVLSWSGGHKFEPRLGWTWGT